MKILIIEDEEHVVNELQLWLSNSEPRIETFIARSRSSGLAAVRNDEFDYIVCDLWLPPNDGGLDTDEAHGLAVHSEAKTVCPGTPSLFFTGFSTSQNVADQLSGGTNHDVWGTGNSYPMTQLVAKHDFLRCIEYLETFNNELAMLEAIDIEPSDDMRVLDRFERRALQMLARSLGGTSIEAEPLGGHSGATTLRVIIRDYQARSLASYFVKIDLQTKLTQELSNYNSYVFPLINMGGFPPLGRGIDAGIGKRLALVYQPANDFPESLFGVLERSESDAVAIIGVLRGIFNHWSQHKAKRVVSIRELRTERIDDVAFEPYRAALTASKEFEKIELEITTSWQHGDLHGLNVLCDDASNAVIIDFGNVGVAPTSVDPIQLELSLLFHPESPFRDCSWPSVGQAGAWFNLEEYLLGCPIPNFVRKCREWAYESGDSTNLPSVAYAEAVRQLKYPDTDDQVALGIARAAIASIPLYTSEVASNET